MLGSQECYRQCAYFDAVISERVLCLFHKNESGYNAGCMSNEVVVVLAIRGTPRSASLADSNKKIVVLVVWGTPRSASSADVQ